MAERPPLPVEILTIIVWLICVDCLDVVLLSKDLASHSIRRAPVFCIDTSDRQTTMHRWCQRPSPPSCACPTQLVTSH